MSNWAIKGNRNIVVVSLVGIVVIVIISLSGQGLFSGLVVFESCFESDPQLDYYVKGYAKYASKRWEDDCSSDGQRLQQAYCKSSVKLGMTSSYICPYGCQDGACIAPEVNCGNGIVNYGERCDDGNKNDDDGCDNSCEVELGYTCRVMSICSQEP